MAGLKYGSSNVLADPGIRDGVKKYTDWPTIPQVCFCVWGGETLLGPLHSR
jgi:glutaredoxin-related protein